MSRVQQLLDIIRCRRRAFATNAPSILRCSWQQHALLAVLPMRFITGSYMAKYVESISMCVLARHENYFGIVNPLLFYWRAKIFTADENHGI